ncbi:MAG: ABC transporter permease [bacterium]|nr:ABC transporter permease [bacterium]
MRRLTLKAFRDLRSLGLRGWMAMLIIACQSAVFSGGLCARRTLRRSVDDFCAAHNLADLQVTFNPTSAGRLPALDGLEGVRRILPRLMLAGAIHLADGTLLPAAVIFIRAGENPAVNTLAIEAGALPAKTEPGIVIERGLAAKGYRVGDGITVSAYGLRTTRPIVGIARSPEFLVSTANPELLIPTPGSLGVMFAPLESWADEMEALSRHVGGAHPVNQLLFLYGGDRDGRGGPDRGVEGRILDRLSSAGVGVAEVLRRDDQFGIAFLRQDLKLFRVLVLAIVGIFSVLTLAATGITVNRIVASQSREIGALMALGYRPGTIMRSYLRLGLLMGCAGGALGLAASPVVNLFLAGTYASAMDLPPVTLAFDPAAMAGGLLIGIGVAAAAAIMPVVGLARLTPIRAIRGEARASAPRIPSLGGAARALSRPMPVSLPQRAAARNLFRRPRLTVATILLLALGLGVTAGFVTTLTSVIRSSASLLRRYGWDAVVDFTGPLPCDEAIALCGKAGLVMPEPFVSGHASVLGAGGSTGDYRLVGVPARSEMSPFLFIEGGGFSGDDADEIIFNTAFSDGTAAAPGNVVTVRAGGRSHALKVTGLVSLLSTRQCFVPIGTARRILGLRGKCSGIMAGLGGADRVEVERRLYASRAVARVTARADLEEAIDEQLAKAAGVLRIAVVLGSIVALAVMVNTMSMHILEREGEFATLVSLGYGRLPLSRMVLTEVLAMGLAALVIAVPVALGVAHWMNAELSRVWFRIDTAVTPREFGITLLVPFLLLPLGAAPALRHVFTLDAAQAVRRHAIE